MNLTTRYNIVLETTLKSGRVVRDTVQANLYDEVFVSKLAGNMNASIRAAKHAGQFQIDAQVVIVPEVLQ